MKLSKQARKQILAELNEIRDVLNKQASSGFFKPEPIEYEDEADLDASIDSVLLDIVDGFGFLSATNMVVKGGKAYVKVEGEIELSVSKITYWYKEQPVNTNYSERVLIPEVLKGLGRGFSQDSYDGNIPTIVAGSGEEVGQVFYFPSNSYPLEDTGMIVDHGAGNYKPLTVNDLTGDFDQDIKLIVAFIKKGLKKVR